MTNFVEPYIKEKNILQLSLFYFGKGKPHKTVVEWSDTAGKYRLECVCKFGVPGSFDQDCYTAVTRIWVRNGMPNKISLNYSDIARELRLDPPRAWVTKIKKALERLSQARYQLTKCFIKADDYGNQKIDTHFSLFDSASLFTHRKGERSKFKSQSEIYFPDVIRDNLEKRYYQLLDMVWYRALSEGLPRRLYEYLAKRRYHNTNGKFAISEKAICRWLPILDKHTTNRRKRLATIAQDLIKAGYLLAYKFDKERKLCIFTYGKQTPPKKSVPIENTQEAVADTAEQAVEQLAIESQYLEQPAETTATPQDQTTYLEALKWLESIPYFHAKRRDEIAALPMRDVAEHYSGIRRSYEQTAGQGKRPKPGWVYNAFIQKWKFETEPEPPETPEGKRSRQARAVYEEMDKLQQTGFWQHMREYTLGCMSEEKLEQLKTDGGIWQSWGPMLMEQLGLLDPVR